MQTADNIRTASATVALTFDDGPSGWTPAALEALAGAGAHATFFVIAGRRPDVLQEIVNEGHEVGYHCGRHRRHSERTRDEVEAEASADLAWLRELGAAPSAWRAPWGDLAPWSEELAADLGLALWHWSDDTHDWDGRGEARMMADLERTIGPGSVVLMHDGLGPGALRTDVRATIALIAPLVELCRERGLEPGPLVKDELAHA